MKRSRFATSIFVLWLLIGLTSAVSAQDSVPTLTPPTLVPQDHLIVEEGLPTQSAVARIRESGVVNVGVLYNEPPFGQLNIRGGVSGYDADLANSLASTWGVNTHFVQVTRNPQEIAVMLRAGEIDMAIAAVVHRREFDPYLGFSMTYHLGEQSVMVLPDANAPVNTPSDMANRRLGVVQATAGADAVERWRTRNQIAVEVLTYPTLDLAYRALVGGEVAGIVDSEHRLLRVASQQLDAIKILDDPIEYEPYALVFQRQDEPMRDLVNRTLQYITYSTRMNEIQQVHFPGAPYRTIRVWENLPDEAPNPSQYADTITYPMQYVVSRIQNGSPLRVAGLFGAGEGSPESQRRLDEFHRRIFDEMASRWGVQVQYITASSDAALQMVVEGQADVAVGVAPDWNWADRVDFSNTYLYHGERLLVRADSGIARIGDLGGDRVLTPINDALAAPTLREIAQSVTISLNDVVPTQEQNLAFELLNNLDADYKAIFGDSLALVPVVQTSGGSLILTHQEGLEESRWYSPRNTTGEDYSPRLMVLALPDNDLDFRLLVEYTLQEMAIEGRFDEWRLPLSLAQDIPLYELWPGAPTYLGYNLARG